MQNKASFRFNHTCTHCNLKYEMKEQNVIENKLLVRQHFSPKLLQALFFVSNILPGVLFLLFFFVKTMILDKICIFQGKSLKVLRYLHILFAYNALKCKLMIFFIHITFYLCGSKTVLCLESIFKTPIGNISAPLSYRATFTV